MIYFTHETKFKITKKLFGRRGAGERGPKVSDFFTKNPNLKNKILTGEWAVDGRTDEQPQTDLPLQLLRSWGHNNA